MQDEGGKPNLWRIARIGLRNVTYEKERPITVWGIGIIFGCLIKSAASVKTIPEVAIHTSRMILRKEISLSFTYRSICGCGSAMRAFSLKEL
jgi:hypothetical protein